MTPLAPHVTAFFQRRLRVERRVSPHTSDSYAYTFKLLLEYASARLHVPPSALHMEQIDAPLVVAFLNDLEATRGNRPSSRNVRLAAIKSFMHFLEFREPAAIDQIPRILAIPPKKADTRLVRHLTAGGNARGLECARAVRLERCSRSGDAPPVLRWRAAGLGAGGLAAPRRGPSAAGEYPRARQGSTRALLATLESHRRRIARLAGRARHGARTRSLRQRTRPAADARRFRGHPRQTRLVSHEGLPIARGQAHLAPRLAPHTCALTVLQATKDLRKVSLWLGHAHMQTTEMCTGRIRR